jgi:hypothetical protein
MTPEEIANTPGLGSSGIGVSGGGENLTSKEKAKGVIYEQIKGQSKNLGTAKTFQTGAAGTKEGGLGSVDSVMWDMAKRLSDAGLTSIEQLGQGQVPVYQKASVYPETRMGKYLRTDSVDMGGDYHYVPIYEQIPTGRWLYQIAEEYGDGGTQLSAPRLVSEADVERLNLSGAQSRSVDITTGTKPGYINKETGEPLTALTGYDGRGWSGTGAGDGQTIYNVQFDPTTGLPIFYNQQKHGRDKYADLLKIAAIGTAIFAPQIGAAILPAGSSAAAALAVGSAVSGFIGSGGNLEAGIKAGLAGYLGGKAGSWASKASNSAFVGSIASNMTRTAILGGDMDKALVSSLIQVAPQIISQYVPSLANLPRAVQETAVTAVADLLATGGDNLGQIALMGVSNAATDYAVKNIPGYSGLRSSQQEIIRTRLSNVLQGESLSNELLQGAISYGQEAVQNEVNNEKAKKDGWADYATQQAAKSLYGSKVTPDLYADKQDTTEAEAKQIARDILGREPTEFEYMQLIGLPEREAAQNSDLAAIKYDESYFDQGELIESYKALYGKEPTNEWLASDEAMDMLERSEAQGKNILQNLYIQDKNTTNNTEAEAIWKEMGNTGPIPEDLLFKMLSTSEDATRAMSETHRIRSDDIEKTTFNGSGYDSRVAAERAAKAAGYNTYKWDGADYPIRATAEIKAIQDKRHELTEGILKQQGTTVAEATDEQLIAALAKVDALPTSYLKQATIQDVIKGTYSVIDADGKFKVEVTGANIVADSPASVVQKAKDQLPKGMTLASDAEVWGVGGERNPNVEYMVLPDGTTAYVKRDAGTQLPEQFIVAKRLDDLEVNDPEAWLGLAAQFDEKQDGTVSDYLVNTANSLMLGAYATGNKDFGDDVKQTLSLVTQAVGQQTADLASAFASQLGLSYDNAFVRAGKALQEWGAANQTKSTKNQEEGFFKRINDAKGVVEKIKAIPGAIRDYPGGFTTMVLKEGIQEILPLWAARSVAHLGRFAAHSANTSVEVMGVWGNGAGETYADAIKMGYSEQDARVMASKVGLQSAAITAVTNGIGDMALVNRVIGGAAKDSLTGITKAGVREGVTEYFDELLQNATKQYQLTGQVNWDQATTAATIGMGVGAGTTAGIMTGFAIKSGTVIGQDAFGEGVTYEDFMSGARQVDMSTVSLSAPVGVDADGEPITLGNLTAMPMASGISYEMVKSGLPSSLTNSDVVLGVDASGKEVTLSDLMSGVTENLGYDTAYKNLLDVTPQQRTAVADKAAADAKAIKDAADAKAAADAQAAADAKAKADADAKAAAVAQAAADKAAADAKAKADAAAAKAAQDASDAAAAKAAADAAALAAQKAQEAATAKAATDAALKAQADANAASAEATRLANESMNANLTQTKSDILSEVAKNEAAGLSRDASLQKALDTVSAAQKTDSASLLSKLGTTEDALKTQIATELSGVKTQISDLENSLSDEIQAAKDIGLEGDAALQAGLDSLSEKMGVDQAALLTQLGTTAADLKTQFAADLSGVSKEVEGVKSAIGSKTTTPTEADVSEALKVHLGKSPFDAKYDWDGDGKVDLNDTLNLLKSSLGKPTTVPAAENSFWNQPTGLYKEIQDSIAGIKFPEGLSAEDVTTAISGYMAANPGLSAEDVANAISTYMTANPGLTKTDLDNAVTAAVKDFATTKDITDAIAGIEFPAGLSKEDVASSIADYMTANPGLSLSDVASKITEATSGLATSEGVTTAIGDALKGYATTQDIKDAIAGIEFPAGISKEDVSDAIKTYMTENPGLSLTDVANAITTGTSGLATSDGVTKAIGDALKGYATAEDIETAISNIKFPAGLSKDDVSSAIKTYMEDNPGLSLADVASKIGEATKGLATSEGVKTDIAAAIKGLATTEDIKDAISNIQFPVGLTKEDVADQVKAELAANPNLTAKDVTDSIAAYMKDNPGLTAEDVSGAIKTAVSGLATQESLEQLQTDLSEEIQAAKDIGLEGDAALQAGLDSLSDKMGVDQAALLTQLGTTAADLKTQFASDIAASQEATAEEIANTKTALETAIADAKAAGLEGDAALQAAIEAVAADQQTSAADLLTKLGTTEADLKSEFAAGLAGVSAEVADARKALEDAIQAAQDIGLEGDAALQAGIESVAAELGTTKEALLGQLGTTEETLRTDMEAGLAGVTTSIADTRTALEAAIADAKASGLEGDAALQAAIDSVAADQQTNAADLLTKLGTTEAGLKTEFEAGLAGVSTEIANAKKALEDAIQAAKDIGLEGDVALQAGIDSVASELGITKEALLGKLGTTEETLRTEFASGITGLETQMKEQYDALTTEQKALADALTAQGTTLADAIAAAQESTATQISELEAATNAQYEALTAEQKALADALTEQGTTLSDAIAAAQKQTEGQITDVETRLTDAISAAEAMGLSRDQAITAAVDSVAAELGTTRADLLTQLGTTEAALRTEFATGISGLEAQTKAQYDSLSAAQKATADALVAQGTTLADAITSAQEQTAGQIADVETRLTDAIAAAEATGLSRDQAITAAVESVAADLGTTKADLLTQLGTTEQALRTEFTTGLAGVSAEVKAAYDSLTADQKALADQLAQQGVDLTTAIQTAQEQTQTQIGDLTADVQAKFDALTEEQKALATSLQQQGVDLNTAIETAQQQTQQQISDLGVEVDARINELMQQGQTYQQATQTAFAEVNAKNQEMAGLIGTQGRTASQQDIDALTQMLSGQREVDLAYDVTGDKQITQADIDFLTQVVGGVKTDWTAPQESPWAATGLYGQIQANELRRQQDLAATEAQRVAEQQAAAERARQESVRGGIRTTALQGQQQLQALQQQLPQSFQMSQTTSTPIYGEMGPYLDLGSPLDLDFFKPSPEKQAATKQAQPTKIAAGGYIDDLLVGDMSVDDLMNLLR